MLTQIYHYVTSINLQLFLIDATSYEKLGQTRLPKGHKITNDELLKRYYPREKNRTAITSVMLPDGKFDYENYILKATIVVYEDSNKFKEIAISAKIETNFATENRSDWLDSELGV